MTKSTAVRREQGENWSLGLDGVDLNVDLIFAVWLHDVVKPGVIVMGIFRVNSGTDLPPLTATVF